MTMSEKPPSKKRFKPLGEKLIDAGLITPEKLQVALAEQKRTKKLLGEILVGLKFVTADEISEVIARESDTAFESLSGECVSEELRQLIPEKMIQDQKILPVKIEGKRLTLAMVDTFDILTIDQIQEMTGLEIKVVAVTMKAFREAFERSFVEQHAMARSLENAIKEADLRDGSDITVEGDAPVARMVNEIIETAVRQHATDIHIEPEEQIVRVRYRIDGVLVSGASIPKKVQAALESRVKIMGGMNISERRIPQDGRITFQGFGRNVDIRASTMPTVYGENVVLRVLDLEKVVVGLEGLGFSESNLAIFKTLLEKPFGIVLVTGPTGSGKTTTLYSGLLHLNSLEKNVMTLEDPVEYRLPLIRQSQINPKAGFTFAAGLRALLRQDPDVILVGEMRDSETVDMAIRTSLTGHLVLSTLHTNDAASALPRLLDMGVNPYLLPSTIAGIVAQRLVRKICTHCAEPYQAKDEELQLFGIQDSDCQNLRKGVGCERCGKTGYKGRIGIYEILTMNKEIIHLIQKRESGRAISEAAIADGMVDMRSDGAKKIAAGLTTFSEVLRVSERRVSVQNRKTHNKKLQDENLEAA